VAFIVIGALAGAVALVPAPWIPPIDDAGAHATSRRFLRTVAPFYVLIGLASAMYFSSQGASNVLGLVLAQTAASMMLVGAPSCAAVALTRWGPKTDAKRWLNLASVDHS